MKKHSMRVQGLAGALLFLAGVGTALWLSSGDTRAADAKDVKVKALLKERLATLRDIAMGLKGLQQIGMVTPDRTHAANQAVNSAELDLCETDQQRTAILDRMLAEAKNYETLAHTPELQALDQQAPLKAKVARIDVEIAVERAKAK